MCELSIILWNIAQNHEPQIKRELNQLKQHSGATTSPRPTVSSGESGSSYTAHGHVKLNGHIWEKFVIPLESELKFYHVIH